MRLSDPTAKSLSWLAALILLTGLMIDSPAGNFFFAIVAGALSLVPLLFGTTRRRIYAGIVFAIATLLALTMFGEYRKEAERYRTGGKRNAALPTSNQPINSYATHGDPLVCRVLPG